LSTSCRSRRQGDPITAARIDAIREARGGEPFGECQVPLAILALQQGSAG
jgi:hypothetical protein